jgi:integrase
MDLKPLRPAKKPSFAVPGEVERIQCGVGGRRIKDRVKEVDDENPADPSPPPVLIIRLSNRHRRWARRDVDLVCRSITQGGGILSRATRRTPSPDISIPVPQRLVPILDNWVSGGPAGAPAITSPNNALLGLENWKRSAGWREAIVAINRPNMRVHDLRRTYASLARRAGADLRLLRKTMGHASIAVTAHVCADLYDDELDDRPSE